MTLFEFRPGSDFQPGSDTGGWRLELDDLLSFGGDDLGLDVDAKGHLVLTEGVDFE